jgi:hypothetical protein
MSEERKKVLLVLHIMGLLPKIDIVLSDDPQPSGKPQHFFYY